MRLNQIVLDRLSTNRALLLELGQLVNNLDDEITLGIHCDGDHIIYEALSDLSEVITEHILSNTDEEDSI